MLTRVSSISAQTEREWQRPRSRVLLGAPHPRRSEALICLLTLPLTVTLGTSANLSRSQLRLRHEHDGVSGRMKGDHAPTARSAGPAHVTAGESSVLGPRPRVPAALSLRLGLKAFSVRAPGSSHRKVSRGLLGGRGRRRTVGDARPGRPAAAWSRAEKPRNRAQTRAVRTASSRATRTAAASTAAVLPHSPRRPRREQPASRSEACGTQPARR